MDLIDLIQWPAMVVTVVAAWLIASQKKRKREVGFWCFLASNVLWVIWGWHDGAYALIALQIALAALNVRGVWKNDSDAGAASPGSAASAR
jgi:hypothetical protein